MGIRDIEEQRWRDGSGKPAPHPDTLKSGAELWAERMIAAAGCIRRCQQVGEVRLDKAHRKMIRDAIKLGRLALRAAEHGEAVG